MTHAEQPTAIGALAAVSFALLPLGASAAEIASGEDDRTLSPYFHVKSDDPDADSLPLEETSAEVSISGVIAHVEVSQTYTNEGDEPLEAVYVFPGSTRSAVFDMRMEIGDRIIEADIEKKQAARDIYEEAKKEGKSASLLEQKRPNVFQMNVANIMPGDSVEVKLDYVEALVPEEGIYEFVYPTVVGPRYSEQNARKNPDETWIENPHLEAGEPPPYQWGLDATIHAGMPIQDLRSPSHPVEAEFQGRSDARVTTSDPQGGNRDFVLRYRLSGDKVESGLLLHPGEEENFFLAMVQPPERVEPEMRPPREYVFILDVSGSMRGFPLNTAKGVMKTLMRGLGEQDRFNMMTFSGGSRTLGDESLRATPENLERGAQFLKRQRGGGGTRIRQALQSALSMPRSKEMSTSFVVVTDGYVSVEKESFDLIRDHLGEANLFSFGIGSSVNRFLIEGMARAGMGEPFVVTGPDEARNKATAFQRYIESPVLTDVDVSFDGFRAYDVVPAQVPDVFAERPILVFGKYKGEPSGRIRVSGSSGKGRYRRTFDVAEHAKDDRDNEALRYLWARHKIRELSDYRQIAGDRALAEEITQLGLRYNLMTELTSFVAVDKRVRNQGGESVEVRQPLPMPEGVPDSAVGGASSSSAGRRGAGAQGQLDAPRGPRRKRGRSSEARSPEAEPSAEDEESDEAQTPSPSRLARVRLKRAFAEFRAELAEERSREDDALRGEIRIALKIRPDGGVARVRILDSSWGDEELREELVSYLREQRVPAPGEALTLRISFEL